MSKLFNYRFYYLLQNTIKRRRISSNLVQISVNEINVQNIRFINTTEKSIKRPKTLKPNERLMNYDSKHSDQILKTLDANDMNFSITVTEMTRFLEKNSLKVTDGKTCLSIDCPFCKSKPKSSLNSMNNIFNSKLFVNKKTSNFICYSCQTSGNWISFVDLITNLKSRKSNKSDFVLPKVNTDLFGDESTRKQLNHIIENSLTIDQLSEEQLKIVKNNFDLNFITKSSLQYFDILVSKDLNQLVFPFKSCYDKNTINAIKVIELNESKQNPNKYNEKVFPNDTKLSIFGLNQHFLNKTSFDELVITDSPLDAMAVTQESGIASISMPLNGISANLRPEVLPFFERFKKITIWFSNSVQDLNAAKSFARKLDEKRCYFVGSRDQLNKHMSPMDALKNRSKLSKYLETSQRISHSSITTFHSLRSALLSEIQDPLCSGVLWKRFPELNQLLKGHRSGELTVFTGPTGCGKTTFMSEYSLDLCSQGVRTLWGSFEVKNVRLAKMMLTQFAEKSIVKHMDEFDLWADRLELLPLYFMTFHGQESIEKVLSAMSHAVYVHDIKHVIVDNIQFMLGCSPNSKFDRYWQQDLVLDQFRKFATREDCHVSLVMHPRKEEDMDELNNNSIFGGAKATQEADNVMILQNKFLSVYKCPKYIQITKNRWDGDLGKVPLWFDKDSLSFSPTNRRLGHLFNDYQTTGEFTEEQEVRHQQKANKNLEFARIIDKSVEESDDFRLQ